MELTKITEKLIQKGDAAAYDETSQDDQICIENQEDDEISINVDQYNEDENVDLYEEETFQDYMDQDSSASLSKNGAASKSMTSTEKANSFKKNAARKLLRTPKCAR